MLKYLKHLAIEAMDLSKFCYDLFGCGLYLL